MTIQTLSLVGKGGCENITEECHAAKPCIPYTKEHAAEVSFEKHRKRVTTKLDGDNSVCSTCWLMRSNLYELLAGLYNNVSVSHDCLPCHVKNHKCNWYNDTAFIPFLLERV